MLIFHVIILHAIIFREKFSGDGEKTKKINPKITEPKIQPKISSEENKPIIERST